MQCSYCELFKYEVVFCRNGHALCDECNNPNASNCFICSANFIDVGSVPWLWKRKSLGRNSQAYFLENRVTSNETTLSNASPGSGEEEISENESVEKNAHHHARVRTNMLKPDLKIRCQETDSQILMRHLAEFRKATNYKPPEKIDVYVRSCGPDKFGSLIVTKSTTGLEFDLQNFSPSSESIKIDEEEISTGMNDGRMDKTEETRYAAINREDCTKTGCKTCLNKFNSIINESHDVGEQEFWKGMYEKFLKFDVPCMKDVSVQVNIL